MVYVHVLVCPQFNVHRLHNLISFLGLARMERPFCMCAFVAAWIPLSL